jgi:DNA polymerase elongation subunit (family B)
LKILAWDIETRPLEAYRWGLFDQSPVQLPMLIQPGGMLCFAARWVGTSKKEIIFRSVHEHGHQEMIEDLYDLIDEADALLSWNGAGFDTKHAMREFVQLGMTPPSDVFEIDMLRTVRKKLKFPSNKLEFVANALLGKGKVSHEGFSLWLKCLAGDEKAWKRMQKYNQQDVHLLIELYERLLPWLDLPNANLFDGDGCPTCGSADVHMEGTRVTKVSKYQRYKCNACGAWSRGGSMIERADLR